MLAKVAIVSGVILVIVLAAMFIGVYLAKRRERIELLEKGLPLQGDLTAAQEAVLLSQLHDAAKILRGLGKSDETNFMEPEMLRQDTKIDVGRWLARYDKTVNKEKVSQ